MAENLRVAVIGAGRMGADHIQRLHTRIHGAEVAAVIDIDLDRAKAAIADIPGAQAFATAAEAYRAGGINAAVIATPGFLHEQALLEALELDLPILCEKPLTPDAASAWKVVEAEQKLGRKRIQVGFMRRFDAEYAQLGGLVRSGELGELLMLHCRHRNPDTPAGFTNEMLINDSVVHEFDVIRYLTGEEITSVQVRLGKASSKAPAGQHDPQHVLIQTESGVLADVEIFVNAQFGYEVATQAAFEDGIVDIGRDAGAYLRRAGRWGGAVTPSFIERFGAAYDVEVQTWVDAALRGEIGGPSAWDGYATAACCEAGVEAQKTGEKVAVALNEKPALYGAAAGGAAQ
ncbi:inositol 2-dehydrogenase [Sinomonas cellulolyticus]|jgi:myo-inositol 2-dehydrogenase/D-chiro-inositol 1-dehydrogenase|uniref:Inositol 2-dehydrogenase n=1 Tax=Sinomonas cellulolyticus TaxID=2801916 RepID=A0ABS1JXN5_9MICC|nr:MULTISPECIES: Gfo/Idh/MocA family oxidoreductase [Sinomonas]MBL0704145.1 Gfo/Idh/MocA family oxidoreductase [Sinomonas cellulolyticus]GHG57964.1 inositol 2-dehydrogenase [Sinomonas sp. KCTC 49339]